MKFTKNSPKITPLWLYLGLASILFCAIAGLILLNQWLWSAPSSAPQVAFITATPTLTGVQPTSGRSCGAAPAGWTNYVIKPGDTLSELAARFKVSQERLLQANCLTSPDSLLAGQQLYLPPLATPTPCAVSPPPNWSLYTVRTGDTLYSLAADRRIAVETILQVNCLASPDAIAIGQQLYLPSLPTPTPTVPLPPTPTVPPMLPPTSTPQIVAGLPTPASPSLSQPLAQNMIPPLPAPVPPGVVSQLPAEPEISPFMSRGNPPKPLTNPSDPAPFRPCQNTPTPISTPDSLTPTPTPSSTPPWIDAMTDQPGKLQQGERGYYYACNFPDPTTLRAWMTDPNGREQQLKVQLYLPLNEVTSQIQIGQPQGVALWNPVCDDKVTPAGTYTLKIVDEQKISAELGFHLEKSSDGVRRILIIPPVGPPGTTFQVYYCGYGMNYTGIGWAGKNIEVELYQLTGGKNSPMEKEELTTSWTVPINEDGWGKQTLRSFPNDSEGPYRLQGKFDLDPEKNVQGSDVIWLLPPEP